MNKFGKFGMIALSALVMGTACGGLAACGGSPDAIVENAGSSATIVTDKSPDALPDAYSVAYAFLQKQSELQSYTLTTEGSAVASLAGYRQEISNVTYKNGEDYMSRIQSDSALVNMKHQVFVKGDKVVYRNGFEGETSVATKSDYKAIYGISPDDVALGGFIVNTKTLRYAELESESGDTLTYHFILMGDQSVENGTASESATANMRRQSTVFGGLEEAPKFSDIEIRLAVKKDWTPVRYTVECSYNCKKMFPMYVEQALTCTYSRVNKSVTIPDVKEFNDKIGAEPSEVLPSESEENVSLKMLRALSNSFGENGAALGVQAEVNAFTVPVALDGTLALRLDEHALMDGDYLNAAKFRFDLGLGPVAATLANTFTVRYIGDGEFFVMLNNISEGKDHFLYTYDVRVSDLLPEISDQGIALDGLIELFDRMISVEETEAGYTVTLNESMLSLLNTAFGGLLEKAEKAIGDTDGYLTELLDTEFTSLSVTLEGKDAVTAIRMTVEGTPAGNAAQEQLGAAWGIVSAFEGSLASENGLEAALDLEISAFGETAHALGNISVAIDRDKAGTGDYAGAIRAELGLDLSSLRTLSAIADELSFSLSGGVYTVSLKKDGREIFSDGGDIGSLGIGGLVPDMIPASPLSGLGELIRTIDRSVTFATTEGGYSVELKPELLAQLQTKFDAFIDELDGKFGDLGFFRSLLGFKAESVSLFITGQETVSAIGAKIDLSHNGNVTQGRKIGTSVEIGLLENGGMVTEPLDGELLVRIDPSAVWTGEPAVDFVLDMDLSPLYTLLWMAGTFAPAGSLPGYVSSIDSLTVYGSGSGIALVLKDAAGLPIMYREFELSALMPAAYAAEGGASAGLDLGIFRIQSAENGILLSLGEMYVQQLDELYLQLVQTAVEYVTASAGSFGDIAGQLISSMIGATINGVELFIGNDEAGSASLRLDILGVPVFSQDEEDAGKTISLLAVVLGDRGALAEEERGTLLENRGKVEKLRADAQTAQEYIDRIAELENSLDIRGHDGETHTGPYVDRVLALHDEIAALGEEVQSMIENRSLVSDGGRGLLVLQARAQDYYTVAKSFADLLPADDDYSHTDDETWSELNDLFDRSRQGAYGTSVPAISESACMREFVGEERVSAYLEARAAFESEKVSELNERVAALSEQYAEVSDAAEGIEMLRTFYGEIKKKYSLLPEERRSEVTGYSDFCSLVYGNALTCAKEGFEAIKAEAETLAAGEADSLKALFALSDRYAAISYLYTGRDYMESASGTADVFVRWTSDVPAELSALRQETSSASAAAEEALEALTGKYEELLVSEGGKLRGELSEYAAEDGYDFSALEPEQKAELFARVKRWKHLIARVIDGASVSLEEGFTLSDFLNELSRIPLD